MIEKWRQDLIKDIRFNDARDDIDFPIPETIISNYGGSLGEFTECNHNSLLNNFNKIKDKCNSILEIGIARSERGSSYTLISNKKEDCLYLGVDVRDCSFLNDPENNVYTLKERSENISKIINFLNFKGISELDFIFIDGWHSINQVYAEWEYTKILSKNGIVGFHDTNNHPGPALFINNLNNSWEVEKSCLQDHGITFVWKKQS